MQLSNVTLKKKPTSPNLLLPSTTMNSESTTSEVLAPHNPNITLLFLKTNVHPLPIKILLRWFRRYLLRQIGTNTLLKKL